jgi:hypothetical protein
MGDLFLHDFSDRRGRYQHRLRSHLLSLPLMKTRSSVRRSGAMAAPSGAETGMLVTVGDEARITAREFGYGGPGYCLFEMRCARTRTRSAMQGWYLNWRTFVPTPGMRLIADYRSRQEACA